MLPRNKRTKKRGNPVYRKKEKAVSKAKATETIKVTSRAERLSADPHAPAHFGKIRLFITDQPFSTSLLLHPTPTVHTHTHTINQSNQ